LVPPVTDGEPLREDIVPNRSKTSTTDHVFGALSNPIRREILDMLLEGPRAVQDIAGRFDMTRQSVSEHLRVLLDIGLVSESRQGRYRLYMVRTEPLHHLIEWLTPYEQFWRARLAAMRELLDEQVARQTWESHDDSEAPV
jgi:DNA-binding transcriptional ArsR family regulator